MANTPPGAGAPQAKILQGRAARTLVVVLILGAMVLALRWYQNHKSDPGDVLGGSLDSAGMVEAIQYTDNGDHVVAFNIKGERIEQKGIRPGARDADPIWRPDGNRIFFVSDRDGKAYQVYRWTPKPDTEPEARSLGTQGKSHPSFPLDTKDPDAPMLLVSGGFVLEFDPTDSKGHQVLPPQGSGVTQSQDEEGGSGVGQFSGVYGQLGDRFRIARWDGGTDAIVAVMGSDRGEVLIVQPMTKPGETPQLPIPITTGEHIDFDVNAKDGSVVFTVQNYLWTSDDPTPKDKRFRHYIGMWKPGAKTPEIWVPSPDDGVCFSSPAISPAGDKVLVVGGAYDRKSDNLTSKALLIMPTEGNVRAGVTKLIEGAVYEPAWNPKGDVIAYAKAAANGTRGIYIAGADGSGEHTLTGDTGTYGHPLFSPQMK